MKRLLLLPIFAVAMLFANAQDLTKEIVIDRDIEANLGTATRVANYPEMVSLPIDMPRLKFNSAAEHVDPDNTISPLTAAKWGDACAVSTNNGYAAIGYFPTFNLGASIGYRFINKPATSLGAWLQYNGKTYKDLDEHRFDRNTLTFGADFSHYFNRIGRLTIAFDYTWNALNRPWLTGAAVDSTFQTNQVNFLVRWNARKHDIVYFADIAFNHFGFDNIESSLPVDEASLKPNLSQNILKFEAGLNYFINDRATLGCDADVDIVGHNAWNRLLIEPLDPPAPLPDVPYLIGAKGRTLGLISLNPAFGFHNDRLTAKLGLKAQVTVNSGRTFHLAPDIAVSYRPDWWVSVNLSATGGERINRLSSLFARMPYMSVSIPFEFSHVPIDLQASLRFGRIHGVALEFFGGYADSNDWLMPHCYREPQADNPTSYYCVYYAPTDISGWHYGAKLDIRAGSYVDFSLKYEGNPGTYNHSGVRDLDRAKNRLDAKAVVTPFKRLTVEAGFHMRSGRAIYSNWNPEVPARKIDLDNYTSLNIGGRFALLNWLTIFADVENVLNNRALEVWMHERQGVMGLVGAELKF